MAQVRIVTDTLADIPEASARELDISTVPALVRFGDTSFRDKIDLTVVEFYKRLTESPVLPTTSQTPPGAFEAVYRELAKTTDQIFSLHAVSSLTGIYNSACLAAVEVPNVKIEVMDSQQVSMAQGWLVIMAARAARDGADLREIKTVIADAIQRTHIIAMLDTLEFVQRGGRLGKGSALVGALLNVKPILSIVNGQVQPVEKVRTQRRALERLHDIVLGSGPIQELAVMHAAAPDLAAQLKNLFVSTFPEELIIVGETGPVIGTHTGPGAVGVAWVNGKY